MNGTPSSAPRSAPPRRQPPRGDPRRLQGEGPGAGGEGAQGGSIAAGGRMRFAQLDTLHGGVDGCAGGWFVVARGVGGGFAFGLFESWTALYEQLHTAARILVDMPIGLPGRQGRACDRAARRRLPRGRASSVFPVPAREAVYAADYRQACERNLARLGKRISRQSWNICARIRSLDSFLREAPERAERILEAHPELCFAALGGAAAVRVSKKTEAGRRARLQVLQEHWPAAHTVYAAALQQYPRGQVARDDVLDAMVLAVAAGGRLQATVTPTEYDEAGLPMQILHPG